MVYETTYDTGLRPFVPDTQRGYWAHPHDFIYAGLALVFRLDFFSLSWFFSSQFGDTAVIPTYLLTLALYAIPIMVMQSFLGQFSSSSYISAFRLAPLFKGVGYITLAINLCVIMYYSIFAVIPLAYMFASMQPTLPWSCDGFKKWATNLTEEEEINLCNIKFENATDDMEGNDTMYEYINHHIPSVLYFKHMFNGKDIFFYADVEFAMSWQLVLCSIIVWTVIAIIIYKFFDIQKMGELIRYSVWTFLSLLCVCLLRFSFLPGAGAVYRRLFLPHWSEYLHSISMIPIYGLSAFGPGWGLIITLSSFNKFKTDIKKTSWVIGVLQMLVMVSISLLGHLSERYFKEITNNNYYSRTERVATLYLSSGSVMADMAWANLWSILFYFMLFLGAFTLIVIQLFSILTTIFDEFANLRERKTEICMMLTGAIAFTSLYFTSNHGVTYFNVLSTGSVITQNTMNLLLILIVLWIYGRVRFQRDIEFMISKRFSTWQINSLRFVIPLFILLALMKMQNTYATLAASQIFCTKKPMMLKNFRTSDLNTRLKATTALTIGIIIVLFCCYHCQLTVLSVAEPRSTTAVREPFINEPSLDLYQFLSTATTYAKSAAKSLIAFADNFPTKMLMAALTAIIVSFMEHAVAVPGMVVISVTFVFLPWIFVPLYALHSMYQSIGTIGKRFQHCCRPNDWYPVDAEERQRYEEAMGNTDVTHHLNEITEEM